MSSCREKKQRKSTRTEVWLHPGLLDDEQIQAMPSDEKWASLFRAACDGEINQFSRYIRVLPAGEGPPLDDPTEADGGR